MSKKPSFDIATAALEYLELLNHSDQNPLEVAAQFRILLRSKRNNQNEPSSTNDYTHVNDISADTAIRKISCSPKLHSSDDLSKCPNLGVSSPANRFHYPTINWKQLRKKRYEHKLEQFISTKLKGKDLTLSSLTTISNLSKLPNNFQEISFTDSPNHSASIRTPAISPLPFPQATYTISGFNSTSMTSEDILFPIADCNLVIKHKSKRISHLETFCHPNNLFCY